MPTTDSSSCEPGEPERQWLKPSKLAAEHGVSRSTVWRWVDKGLVEARRVAPKTGVQVRQADPE
jgi:predicted DNA-binding transcriptional regulator AlpA